MSDGNGLVKTIEIKDKHGRVIETKEVVTYAGLLNRAHQEGLKQIRTRLVQVPSGDNEMTAISMAEIVTDKGVFRDYGDANPGNVNSRIIPHIIRMSITRAKARALRDAINLGVVSMEELGSEYGNGNGNGNGGKPRDDDFPNHRHHGHQERSKQGDSDKPMTDHQRKYLFRLLSERSMSEEQAEAWLKDAVQLDSITKITKKQASDLIDHLVKEAATPQQSVN